MRPFVRLPLYLGLTVFVVSVILAGVTISDGSYRSRRQSRANRDRATLSLLYTTPDFVSVAVSSPIAVAGVDVTVHFDNFAIDILPTSLIAGPAFTTTGGLVGEDGTFTFSALTNGNQAVTNGIVATFQIVARTKDVYTSLSFETMGDATSVFSKETQSQVPFTTQDLTVSF